MNEFYYLLLLPITLFYTWIDNLNHIHDVRFVQMDSFAFYLFVCLMLVSDPPPRFMYILWYMICPYTLVLTGSRSPHELESGQILALVFLWFGLMSLLIPDLNSVGDRSSEIHSDITSCVELLVCVIPTNCCEIFSPMKTFWVTPAVDAQIQSDSSKLPYF